MDLESQILISKILKLVDSGSGYEDQEGMESLIEISDYLKTDNAMHSLVSKNLHVTLVDSILKKNKPSQNKQRIKYKSQINTENMENLINFSIWKNAPSTNNLFAVYEHKKNNFNNSKSNLNVEDEPVEKKFNYNKFKYKNTKNLDDEEDDVKIYQSNTYMTNTVNLKKKNNTLEYENYTNSIYNVNKKKNNKKNAFRYKDDEDEEEVKEETGFKSAITEINKRVFNKKGGQIKKNIEPEEDISISTNNVNKTGTYKKFNPPAKNNSNQQMKEEQKTNNDNKETMIDEKLKGFDKNMIEFVESEILSFNPNIKWEDIAGLQFAKKTIKEIIIWPLLRPDIFNGIRRPPKGLLLFGPPGTGKTMIAKAIASESKSKFFNISASSLMSKWIGESEKLVRTLFALASYYQPSVVFIDEIDSILTARSENECEASRRLKTEFLVQLDGAGTNQDDRILIIGATNRPQEIDDAFIRRMAKRLYIPLPDIQSRKQLIETVINKEREKSKYDINDVDVAAIVQRTKGYSGSDMMSVCREAAMMPIRCIDVEDISSLQIDNLRGINLNDFFDAINVVKPSVSEKTIVQYNQWNKDFGSFQFDEIDNGK